MSCAAKHKIYYKHMKAYQDKNYIKVKSTFIPAYFPDFE